MILFNKLNSINFDCIWSTIMKVIIVNLATQEEDCARWARNASWVSSAKSKPSKKQWPSSNKWTSTPPNTPASAPSSSSKPVSFVPPTSLCPLLIEWNETIAIWNAFDCLTQRPDYTTSRRPSACRTRRSWRWAATWWRPTRRNSCASGGCSCCCRRWGPSPPPPSRSSSSAKPSATSPSSASSVTCTSRPIYNHSRPIENVIKLYRFQTITKP